jgi:hypothetical protein
MGRRTITAFQALSVKTTSQRRAALSALKDCWRLPCLGRRPDLAPAWPRRPIPTQLGQQMARRSVPFQEFGNTQQTTEVGAELTGCGRKRLGSFRRLIRSQETSAAREPTNQVQPKAVLVIDARVLGHADRLGGSDEGRRITRFACQEAIPPMASTIDRVQLTERRSSRASISARMMLNRPNRPSQKHQSARAASVRASCYGRGITPNGVSRNRPAPTIRSTAGT